MGLRIRLLFKTNHHKHTRKMKFVAMILLVAIVGANAQSAAQIGTDFVIDNIVNPLLQNLQTNALGFLFNTLNNLIGSIGKRDISLSGIKEVILSLFNAHKDKLTALLGQYSSQLISLASNFLGFLGPQKTTKQMAALKLEANYAAELKALDAQFLNQIVSTLSGFVNGSALTSRLQGFFSQFEGLLTGAFDNISGSLFNTIASIAQQALPQFQQLQGQLQSQIQQLASQLNLGNLVNLLG